MGNFSIIVEPSAFEASSRGAVTGLIHVKAGERYFPDEQWNDFIVVVLGWWCDALLGFLETTQMETELLFMDGPFCMRLLTGEPGALIVELRGGRDRALIESCITTREVLRWEIVRAGQAALRFCTERRITNSDVLRLQQGVCALGNGEKGAGGEMFTGWNGLFGRF